MTFWETRYGRYRRLKKLGINVGISAPLKNRDIILGYGVAVLISALMLAFIKYNQTVVAAMKTWWGPLIGIGVVILIGQLLFAFKTNQLIWYGRVEVAVALVAGFISLINTQNPSWVPSFLGSIYIYVRGVSNISDAKNKLVDSNDTESKSVIETLTPISKAR